MTTKQLLNRIDFMFSGHGHYRLTLSYRGKEYKHTTTNMQAIDAAKEDFPPIRRGEYYETQKQALQALYNEVKQAHNLR